MSFFYRFRPTDALLGNWEELEKQEIYFASLDQLNDPMEGFKDVFWSGDRIVWANLIKHYLLCLIRKLSLVLIAGEAYNADLSHNLVFSSNTNHPTPQFHEMYKGICLKFFFDSDVQKIPDMLSSCQHKIRREELKFYIRGLHGRAVMSVIEGMRKNGLFPPSNLTSTSDEVGGIVGSFYRILNESIKNREDQERKFFNQLFLSAEQVTKQLGLMKYIQATEKRAQIWQTAIVEFPDDYVRSLDKLIFYPWYAACFVSDPSQAAMWGNYGDGHKGVCLKFRTIDDANSKPCLNLRQINGWSGNQQGIQKIYGDAKHQFYEMNYVDKFVEIDFFRSIGRITIPALNSDWYLGDDGKLSSCADEMRFREEKWRKSYWERFKSTITTKFIDWRHENERRLILYSMLNGFEDPADRKLVYHFSDLQGIIFGINTSLDEKNRIVNIIKQKCTESKRENFEFGQAYYSAESGRIEIGNQNFF